MDFTEAQNTQFPFSGEAKRFIEMEEELSFNLWLKDYPIEEHETITERLQYIRAYVLHFPSYDGDSFFPSNDAEHYYKFRKEFIGQCDFTEKQFNSIKELQDAIKKLGLSPKGIFEFVVFLWAKLKIWEERQKHRRIEEKLNDIIELKNSNIDAELRLEITVGRKHFCFTNENLIKDIISTYRSSGSMLDLCENIQPLKREIDYYFVKTLLTYLPINVKKRGKYSQAERDMSLCLLWLNRRIVGDIENALVNATFDKLMREYKNTPIPAILLSHF